MISLPNCNLTYPNNWARLGVSPKRCDIHEKCLGWECPERKKEIKKQATKKLATAKRASSFLPERKTLQM